MRRSPVDNSTLERWRDLDCLAVLRAVADYAKQDATFTPRERIGPAIGVNFTGSPGEVVRWGKQRITLDT